jgi:hypothetical protein
MSRQTTIALVGAAVIGVGLLSMSSAFAAPINGTVIGEVASNGGVTQKVIWRGGWRGGVGWRGVGWRYSRGWRPGLAAAGAAATGIAATAAYNNYGYGYGPNFGPGPYAGTSNYIYTTATFPRDICCYTVVPGYTPAGYGDNYGYGHYLRPGLEAAAVGAAAAGATAAGATAAGATAVGRNVRVAQARYAYRHNFARER